MFNKLDNDNNEVVLCFDNKTFKRLDYCASKCKVSINDLIITIVDKSIPSMETKIKRLKL